MIFVSGIWRKNLDVFDTNSRVDSEMTWQDFSTLAEQVIIEYD